MRGILLVVIGLLATACGGSSAPPETSLSPGALCADVIEVSVFLSADGSHSFDVTVRSADTGWEKYADLWEVAAADGTVLGARILAHPHVDEQPFTRSQTGIEIPDDVATVTVRARDSVEGFCGAEIEIEVPG